MSCPAVVWVAVYIFRTGENITVHATEAGALAGMAALARQWWADATKRDDTLPAEPPEDDTLAARLYFEAMAGSESYDIDRTEVQP